MTTLLRAFFPRKSILLHLYDERTEERSKQLGYEKAIALNEMFLGKIFGKSESLLSVDTQQVDDYSKIEQNRFDPEKKAARRKEYFPQDCQKAFEMADDLHDVSVILAFPPNVMFSSPSPHRSISCISFRSRRGTVRSVRLCHFVEAPCECVGSMRLAEIAISSHEPSRHVHDDLFALFWADRFRAHLRVFVVLMTEHHHREKAPTMLLILNQPCPAIVPQVHSPHEPNRPVVGQRHPGFILQQERDVHIPAI